MNTTMNDTLPCPEPLDRSMTSELQHVIDTKTKPPGSLGRLEALGLQIGLIQRTLRPRIERPGIIVFAGDHGIAAEGVSPFPQEVTVQMVANFVAGGAAINALSKAAGMTLEVVDAGVANASPAAACLMSRMCDVEIDACVGRGTGLDDAGLNHKRDVLAAALAKHAACADPLDTLATFGGFEIAMIVGAFLAAAEARMTILVDGFIVTSALLVAHALNPAVLDYCVFAHASDETGHRRMLEHLGAAPLLQLGLRLGEGTGAALALPLLRAAVAFINEMASFESAGVSDKAP